MVVRAALWLAGIFLEHSTEAPAYLGPGACVGRCFRELRELEIGPGAGAQGSMQLWLGPAEPSMQQGHKDSRLGHALVTHVCNPSYS
jgi:hypothetical protein